MSEEKSMLGQIIDLPLTDFKKEVVEQKVPIGVLNNVKLNLLGAYTELQTRKDYIIKQITDHKLNGEDQNIRDILDGIYKEMLKIELKSLYLTERISELIDVDSGAVDSDKN